LQLHTSSRIYRLVACAHDAHMHVLHYKSQHPGTGTDSGTCRTSDAQLIASPGNRVSRRCKIHGFNMCHVLLYKSTRAHGAARTYALYMQSTPQYSP
jgi:hypothetical protein